MGISTKLFQEVINKKLRSNKSKWDFINYSDLA